MEDENKKDDPNNGFGDVFSFFTDLVKGMTDDDTMEKLVSQIFSEQRTNIASKFDEIDVAVIMLLSGYLLEQGLKDLTTLQIIQAVNSAKGVSMLALDMRDNGLEVTNDQVWDSVSKVLSTVLEFGFAACHQGLLAAGVDCAPPKANKGNFGDIGIEDPFKDSPEA